LHAIELELGEYWSL